MNCIQCQSTLLRRRMRPRGLSRPPLYIEEDLMSSYGVLTRRKATIVRLETLIWLQLSGTHG
uniref:Uncharacterized protein n=1 Tax=Helianthus annuus TaxID=4232 RepID=A0A251SH32_HELAN